MTTTRADILVRPAGADDLEAIGGISLANDEPVADPDRPGSRYLEHLLRHARLVVAETPAGVVGFGGAIDTPTGWFLTDLFVEPTSQGRGIGRLLLDAVLPQAGARMTFSSADPRALPLYVRAGLAPWWPLLYLRAPADGRTTVERSATATGGLTVTALDGDGAATLERELTGHDRSRDWALWAAGPDRVPISVLDSGRPVGVGFLAGDRLGRLAIGSDVDARAVVLAVVDAAASPPPAARGRPAISGLAIPGPHPATPALLDAGWRIEGADTHMASGSDLLDPTRLLPDPGLA